jgi:hypothetical protein
VVAGSALPPGPVASEPLVLGSTSTNIPEKHPHRTRLGLAHHVFKGDKAKEAALGSSSREPALHQENYPLFAPSSEHFSNRPHVLVFRRGTDQRVSVDGAILPRTPSLSQL